MSSRLSDQIMARVAELRAGGASERAIGADVGISRRQVRRALAELPTPAAPAAAPMPAVPLSFPVPPGFAAFPQPVVQSTAARAPAPENDAEYEEHLRDRLRRAGADGNSAEEAKLALILSRIVRTRQLAAPLDERTDEPEAKLERLTNDELLVLEYLMAKARGRVA